MLHPTGRLIAFAILHQSYSPQTVNPYVPILLNVSCKTFFSIIFYLVILEEFPIFFVFSVLAKHINV